MGSDSNAKAEEKKAEGRSTLMNVLLYGLMAVVVGFGVYATLNPGVMQAGIKQMMHMAEKNNGPEVYFTYLFIIWVGVICLIPTFIMELAGGFIFGPRYGVIMTWLGISVAKLLANIVSVLMARHLFKEFVHKHFVAKNQLLTMAAEAVKDQPLQMAFLVRGSMAPLCVKNYGLGVLDIPYHYIAGCSLIFTPFYAFKNVYIGNSASDLAALFAPKKDDGGSSKSSVGVLLGLACNLLLVLLLFRAIKAQMKKMQVEAEAKLKEKVGDESDKGKSEGKKKDK